MKQNPATGAKKTADGLLLSALKSSKILKPIKEEKPVKNCRTCGHRRGDHCDLCYYSCAIQRRYPAPPCAEGLEGWVPRKPSLIKKIVDKYVVGSLERLLGV